MSVSALLNKSETVRLLHTTTYNLFVTAALIDRSHNIIIIIVISVVSIRSNLLSQRPTHVQTLVGNCCQRRRLTDFHFTHTLCSTSFCFSRCQLASHRFTDMCRFQFMTNTTVTFCSTCPLFNAFSALTLLVRHWVCWYQTTGFNCSSGTFTLTGRKEIRLIKIQWLFQ